MAQINSLVQYVMAWQECARAIAFRFYAHEKQKLQTRL